MNKYQKAALKYVSVHSGWHSFADDKKTVEGILGLCNAGLVDVNEHRQFKITALGLSKEQITIKQYHKIMYFGHF